MNVMINSYCNLKCKYCFAEESMSNGINMNVEDFEKVIDFCKKSNMREFRLIGGEPTLHPNFIYLLVKLAHDPFFQRIHIFSNMTFKKEVLDSIILLSKIKRITMLPNINEEHEVGSEIYERIKHNTKMLAKEKVVDIIGINLYRPNMGISHIFDLANECDIKKIRWAITIPNQKIDSSFDVKGYFKSFVPLVKQLALTAIDNKIQLELDCNSLPICIFSDEDFRLLTYAIPTAMTKPPCVSVLDVKPNLDVIRCFGLSEVHFEKLEDHDNVKGLMKAIDDETNYLSEAILFDECKDCIVYKRNGNRSCSCLAYKISRS